MQRMRMRRRNVGRGEKQPNTAERLEGRRRGRGGAGGPRRERAKRPPGECREESSSQNNAVRRGKGLGCPRGQLGAESSAGKGHAAGPAQRLKDSAARAPRARDEYCASGAERLRTWLRQRLSSPAAASVSWPGRWSPKIMLASIGIFLCGLPRVTQSTLTLMHVQACLARGSPLQKAI